MNLISEWVLCLHLHWLVSSLYITELRELLLVFHSFPVPFLLYFLVSFGMDIPVCPLVDLACSSLSHSFLQSSIESEEGLSEHDFTWIASYMWSECGYIYFVLAALEVLARNYPVLLWHKSKQTKQPNPHLSVEIRKNRILLNQIRSEVLHSTFNSNLVSSRYLERYVKCGKWYFSIYMLFQILEVTGSGTSKQVV